MTEVEFHYNVGDKLTHTCRLLRKARASGSRLLVTAESDMLAQLDRMLWTFSDTAFLPHCRSTAAPTTLARSPIVLTGSTLDPALADHAYHVLVNLGLDVPQGFERFGRFIEVVTSAPDDRLAGRNRWNHYKTRGYALKRYDLAPSPPSAQAHGD